MSDPGTATSPAPQAVPALAVRPGEDPWTPEEVTNLRQALAAEIERLQSQLETASAELTELIGDNSGQDQVDIGFAQFERDHERSLVVNTRQRLDEHRSALQMIELGTYGLCRECGKPIGKGRLEVFPHAELCIDCKQKAEQHALD